MHEVHRRDSERGIREPSGAEEDGFALEHFNGDKESGSGVNARGEED